MMTREQIVAQMAGVRDTVLALIGAHEKAEHGGEVCTGQRASVIAYLMHSLGLTRRQLLTVLGYLDAYDRDCVRQGGCVAHPAGGDGPGPRKGA